MPSFSTVSSLLQSVDSHCLWRGLTDGLPSTLGNVSSRFVRDRTSLRCPPYAAVTSVGSAYLKSMDCQREPQSKPPTGENPGIYTVGVPFYLLTHDSVHGRFPAFVEVQCNTSSSRSMLANDAK